VKDALTQRYKNQVLALRAPFTHGDQKFDFAGRPLQHPEGSWLLFGGIYVQKLKVSDHALRLEGPRIAFTPDKRVAKHGFITLGKSERIEINLDQPLHSVDEAQALLARVFFLDGDSTERAKPEFRRADDPTADGPIYHPNRDGTQPPRSTYTPEPEFSEQARRKKFQGIVVLHIVVDQAGNVARIRLERALGNGLDENAMERIKSWRFSPATLKDRPVAVEMNIEVSFNLY
jgi:TonB family protein